MKVLIVGLGSIGQRHLRNLKNIYSDKLEIIAYRTKKSNMVINSDITVKYVDDFDSYYGIRSIYSFDTVLKEKPSIAFITNPSSLHVAFALKLANIGCHLFIEKPLSHNMNGVYELKKMCDKKKLKVAIGFQLRFHPLLKTVKDYILKIGNLLYARAKYCTYLPSHHPYEDYKTGYAARQDLGGGVVLCLSHEIDYLNYLFGKPQEVVAFGGHLSNLSITAEDTVNALFLYPNAFSVNLVLSFAERNEERTLQIVGDKGKIDLDLIKNTLKIYTTDKNITRRYNSVKSDRDKLFMEEVSNFMDALNGKRQYCATLEEGISDLKTALGILNSLKMHTIINI